MLKYHGTTEHAKRLKFGRCRCASSGVVHDIRDLVIKGTIRDPNDKSAVLTTNSISVDPEAPRCFIFAVDRGYDLHLALDGDRDNDENAVKHETLFHNAAVRAAGEIHIVNGVVVKVTDGSGSYECRGKMDFDPTIAKAITKAFKRHFVPHTPEVRAFLDRKGAGL